MLTLSYRHIYIYLFFKIFTDGFNDLNPEILEKGANMLKAIGTSCKDSHRQFPGGWEETTVTEIHKKVRD